MMRSIKLRAKSANGEWLSGSLHFNGNNPPQILWTNEEKEIIESDIFDYSTIGMYAGFRDKGRKEIYEDDIVHFVNPGLRIDIAAPVVFNHGDFCLQKNPQYLIPMGNFEDSCFEVIGNIHDNPEILKSKD